MQYVSRLTRKMRFANMRDTKYVAENGRNIHAKCRVIDNMTTAYMHYISEVHAAEYVNLMPYETHEA